jgi:signal transduction histidine kinase
MSYVADLNSQPLKLKSFDFRDLWMECASASEHKLAEKSLKLTHEISEESFFIVGDREKLGYILDELITVAAKLADAGATIGAELSHGRERELSFKLSVKGPPMSPGVLNAIFDRPFNTFGKPSAPNKEASVINLSVVYDTVGMHGGRVFVKTGGQGAIFLFTLPAVTAGEENSHEQAVNSGRRRR